MATCKHCDGKFDVHWTGGGVPGGKELEIVDCPHCGKEHSRDMTSAAPWVQPIYDEKHPAPGGA